MDPILRKLEQVSRRGRRVLLAERSSLLLAAAAAGVAAMALADAFFRFPGGVRLAILIGGVGWLAAEVRRRLLPAWRFRPPPVEMALRAERIEPSLAGRLASAVEFRGSGLDRSNPLAAAAVAQAEASLARSPLPELLRTDRLRRHGAALLLAAAAIAASALLLPQETRIGLARVLLPLGDARWPARTEVASRMGDATVLPSGRPLVLAAELLRGDPSRERVHARVREIRDGRVVGESRLAMTRQSGGRFERRHAAAGDEIEIIFESADSESEPQRIRLVPPPAIVSAEVSIEPPAYASAERPPQRFDLGDGTDRRARVPTPQLAGSRASLSILLNKALPPPTGEPDPQAWLAGSLPGLPSGASIAADPLEPRRWTAAWDLAESVRIEPNLRDEHGLAADAEAQFRIEVVEDAPPAVAIESPADDEWVLPQAVIEVLAEARDDLAVAEVGLETSRTGAEAAPPSRRPAAGGPRAAFGESVSIESLGAAAGDRVTLVALAWDRFERDGERREASRSEPRRLLVVGEVEFEQRLREDLAAVRQGAIRADGEQARLLAEGDRSAASQAGITARAGSMAEAIERLQSRVEGNRLEASDLEGVLGEAAARLESAAAASRRAEAALREASGGEGEGDAGIDAREADAAREEVREELERLVSLLDSDEDAWAAMRRLERLAESLEALREETLALSERTLGRDPQELPPMDRQALEGIASRQREIGGEVAELLEQAAAQAERLDRVDQARAEAMRQAAEMGRQAEVEASLRQGAAEAEANRLQQSAERQEQAREGLERMRQRLEETRRIRTEMLRRLMTSLEESIETLLQSSESQAATLREGVRVEAEGDAPAAGPLRRRSAEEAIRLERNTRAVEAEAASGGDDAAEVAALLGRAADRQGEAIGSLRRPEAPLEDASAAMDRSSGLLREALEEVRRLREQAEQEQQRERRESLAAAYREIAAMQRSIAESTAESAAAIGSGEMPPRRALLEHRRLAASQGEVSQRSGGLRDETAELAEAAVFSRSHEWVASWSEEAEDRLRDGDLAAATRRRQALVEETLVAMAESLEGEDADEEAFAGEEESSSGGGGGEGGGSGGDGVFPPIAELRLLRSLQDQAYRRTRALDEAPPRADAERQGELAEIVELQLEIRRLGESLLERLESAGGASMTPDAPPDASPQPMGPPAVSAGRRPQGFAAADPPPTKERPSPPAAVPAAPSAAPSASPRDDPPSLDELLGIEEAETAAEETTRPADGSDDDPQRRRLDERLAERPAADDLREAISAMTATHARLSTEGDAGLATQRLQEEAIRRLDALIAGAERQRRQRSSSSRSSSSQSSRQPTPSPPSGGGDPRDASGSPQGSESGDGEGEPPPFEQGELGRLLEEGRVEWGRLPDRLRELVRQGRRDRISAPYRRWTEEYYRRIAEEFRP